MRAALNKTGYVLLYILFTLISLFFLSLAVWAFFQSAYLLLVVSLIEAGLFLPVYFKRKKLILIRTLAGVLLFGFSSLFIIPEVNRSFARLSAKLENSDNCRRFTAKEKLSIYMLNIYMGVFGYPLYPEASRETLLLMFPADDKVRIYHSDFPYGSEIVKKAIDNELKEIKKSRERTFSSKLREIYWDPKTYTLGNKEARYALALNSIEILIEGERAGRTLNVNVTTATRISYAKNNDAVLIRKPALIVNEGLFRILEECGYFYPYYVVYKFSMTVEI